MIRKNHSWLQSHPLDPELQTQECIRCGIKRHKRLWRKKTGERSVLIRGVWEDKPVYQFGIKWWYGKDHEFNRPNCK